MIEDIFCEILKGERKADVVFKDKDFWVIKDINPQANIHLLIVPVNHFDSIKEIKEKDEAMFGRIFQVADRAAIEAGIDEKGYRLILNEGQDGGKVVPHFHMHLLGGNKLGPKIVN
jgi:histidine triad (HIT) family protein